MPAGGITNPCREEGSQAQRGTATIQRETAVLPMPYSHHPHGCALRVSTRCWKGQVSLKRPCRNPECSWEAPLPKISTGSSSITGEFHYTFSFQSHAYHTFLVWRYFRLAVNQVWPKPFTIMFHIGVKMLHIITHNTSFQEIYLPNTLCNGACYHACILYPYHVYRGWEAFFHEVKHHLPKQFTRCYT